MAKNNSNRRRLPFKREEVFLILLFAVMALDIAVHFMHPAYKYYKQVSRQLETRQKNFEYKILNDFVPTLSLVASNGIAKANAPKKSETLNFDSPSFSVPSSTSTSTSTSSSSSSFGSVQLPRGSHFFNYCGKPSANVRGFVYHVGDMFDGSPILFVNPVFMQTSISRYTFPAMEGLSRIDSQPQTIGVNVNEP